MKLVLPGALLSLPLALALTGPPAARADFRLERDFPLPAGGRFALAADEGSATVRGGDGSRARIVVTSPRDDIEERWDFQFVPSDGELRLRAKRRHPLGGWFSFGRGDSLHYEIQVPRATALTLDTAGGKLEAYDIDADVTLDTSGGSIRAERLQGHVDADTSGGSIVVADIEGEVRLDTSGGSIEANRVRGTVSADTSGGSIRIAEVSADVTASTSGGSIEIEEAGGRVEADTSGGSVMVSFATGNAAGGSLGTSGGGLTVHLDPSVRLDIDAEASGGSVRSDLPLTVRGSISRSSLRGQLNGGGATLRLRASGGGVRIEPR